MIRDDEIMSSDEKSLIFVKLNYKPAINVLYLVRQRERERESGEPRDLD